ncbi:MAG: DUF2997 domain-containing protein [Pseudanabaena sp.]|jgi:hypothetical protein|nr:DUF2997 domain-containing protein [Pseudanabaena sp. M090S1SP2A07QC]MCA6509073.1 DUF2997 domain-containing protein [Pseudanabaena sp. M109S1SP2A07QC]MCA6518404.1 DUF2997 domain-containing protein [Pseudanabaena sp. M110S1SP2A07QC]MCA6523800.1 DUF2997 domain-containing protein [Pseudanabaena sp. M051S1SP2A07QC]MCA6524445.1 DUF2997 domain-containing protein [Pseudanabaena sp. M179S2SP2A07QC]MCA6531923.1 DUF2997 domain-containing protein [Pseudanabaena sp. M125S2SP2A07QC]MCA6533519.1 DUF2997 
METLEFIIYPDGRVEERVTGIIGSSCAEVTAALEAKLGIVAHRELTSENFAQQQVTSQSAMQLDRLSDTDASDFSQW